MNMKKLEQRFRETKIMHYVGGVYPQYCKVECKRTWNTKWKLGIMYWCVRIRAMGLGSHFGGPNTKDEVLGGLFWRLPIYELY